MLFQELLDRTHYTLDVTTGQRRYGGPPPKTIYDGDEPGPGCQVLHSLIAMYCTWYFNFFFMKLYTPEQLHVLNNSKNHLLQASSVPSVFLAYIL